MTSRCITVKRPCGSRLVGHAVLLPHRFVRRGRSRTVAKVDSIGFVVRKCTQYSAGRVFDR